MLWILIDQLDLRPCLSYGLHWANSRMKCSELGSGFVSGLRFEWQRLKRQANRKHKTHWMIQLGLWHCVTRNSVCVLSKCHRVILEAFDLLRFLDIVPSKVCLDKWKKTETILLKGICLTNEEALWCLEQLSAGSRLQDSPVAWSIICSTLLEGFSWSLGQKRSYSFRSG